MGPRGPPPTSLVAATGRSSKNLTLGPWEASARPRLRARPRQDEPTKTKAVVRSRFNDRREEQTVRQYARGVMDFGANWIGRSCAMAVEDIGRQCMPLPAARRPYQYPHLSPLTSPMHGAAWAPCMAPPGCHERRGISVSPWGVAWRRDPSRSPTFPPSPRTPSSFLLLPFLIRGLSWALLGPSWAFPRAFRRSPRRPREGQEYQLRARWYITPGPLLGHLGPLLKPSRGSRGFSRSLGGYSLGTLGGSLGPSWNPLGALLEPHPAVRSSNCVVGESASS